MYNSVWYLNLVKPPLAPPDWLFMPAWTVLYFTLICALFIYIFTPAEDKNKGYLYFTLQVVLNLIWSPAFFLMKNITLALLIVIIMDIFTFLNIKEFYKTSKVAGIILIPYFLWILFATYLNTGYLILN